MGILGNLGNLLQGSGRQTEPVQLLPDERELFRTAGAVLVAGSSAVGGDIVVTNQRLLFTPLNVADVAVLLGFGLQRAGAPKAATALIGHVSDYVSKAATATDVVAIRDGREASLLSPPSVVIVSATGRELEFGVTASRRSLNVSPANEQARRQLVSLVQTQLAGAGRGQRQPSPARTGAAPRIAPDVRSLETTAALTEGEIEAATEVVEDGRRTRIFRPMARGRSAAACLDPRLPGRWSFGNLGSITLCPDGTLTGVLQLFGALPPGRVTGQWWIDGIPEALILNYVCVQSDEEQEMEMATSQPLILTQLSSDKIVTSDGGEELVLSRLP